MAIRFFLKDGLKKVLTMSYDVTTVVELKSGVTKI